MRCWRLPPTYFRRSISLFPEANSGVFSRLSASSSEIPYKVYDYILTDKKRVPALNDVAKRLIITVIEPKLLLTKARTSIFNIKTDTGMQVVRSPKITI
jgi:hypothetical protein